MIHRIINKPLAFNKSFFLFGPRGTGKTTWLTSVFPDAIVINLLEARFFNPLQADPGRLSDFIPKDHKGWVIIDEVQRVPDCLNEVHHLIETQKIKFVLTGSSARKLRRAGINLLAGRAIKYHLYPLTVHELKEKFDIRKSLKTGHLPATLSEESPESYLKTYIQIYLREEVFQESLVRKISHFSKFLEVASFSQGNLINTTSIAREVGVDRGTIENYFDILEDLLIAYRIPCFSKKAKRKTVMASKFYYFDVGVYRAIRPNGPLDSPDELGGGALETLVLQELIALNEYFQHGYTLYFWRTIDGKEIDFVLYGPKGLITIEIKKSGAIRPEDLKGTLLFQKEYPVAKSFIFYGGKVREYRQGITCIPVEEALQSLNDLLD